MQETPSKLTPHEILTNAYNWWENNDRNRHMESLKEMYERYKEHIIEKGYNDLLTLTEFEYHVNRFKK